MSVHKLFVLLFADWVRWAVASYFMLHAACIWILKNLSALGFEIFYKHEHYYKISFCSNSTLTYRLGVKYHAWN